MNKQFADQIITEYLPKIYGFSVKRSFFYAESEELCSDIVEEVYRSLLRSGEIVSLDGYIRRISCHVYSRYVSSKKQQSGISFDAMEGFDIAEIEEERDDSEEKLRLLRREIAYLTKKRREIVYSYYYENKSVAAIAAETDTPVGTVKWHLSKARNDLKEGITMKRETGTLGIRPIEPLSIGHSGTIGKNGGPEYYLKDKLNANIVYSVYHDPRTREEIAEELGVSPVFLDDRIALLEENGFLVRQSGDRFTTYVCFTPETFSQQLQDSIRERKLEIAGILAREYVPAVRRAAADVNDVYIPGGNRELLEAAAVFYGIACKCGIPVKKDISRYRVKTTDGGCYTVHVERKSTVSDPEYTSALPPWNYWSCGSMFRWSEKYPIFAWSVDSRCSSRTGAWQNNKVEDYEYLYEVLTGSITEDAVNACKYERLRGRGYLAEDGRVQTMIVRGKQEDFFAKIPVLDDGIKARFADSALELAAAAAKEYPPQMRDRIVHDVAAHFIGNDTALMVMDILYGNGTFRPLTEEEKITANLLVFCGVLPG